MASKPGLPEEQLLTQARPTLRGEKQLSKQQCARTPSLDVAGNYF